MRRMLDADTIRRNGDKVVINEAVVISDDGDMEVGKNAVIDGDVVVNGVENFKDTEGNPIDFGGGGGTKLYRHVITCILDYINTDIIIWAKQSTAYSDKEDLFHDLKIGNALLSTTANNIPILSEGDNGFLIYYTNQWEHILAGDFTLMTDSVIEI